MSIYKRGKKYYIDLLLHNNRRLRMPAYRDKLASSAMERKIRVLNDRKAAGVNPDPELRAWIGNLPDKTINKLADCGLIDAGMIAVTQSLNDHISTW